jgi:hypothetical protein
MSRSIANHLHEVVDFSIGLRFAPVHVQVQGRDVGSYKKVPCPYYGDRLSSIGVQPAELINNTSSFASALECCLVLATIFGDVPFPLVDQRREVEW